MTNLWFTSDTHFNHENILKFKKDGLPIRKFNSIEEMDELIIENWNKLVKPNDKIYHLGDVIFGNENKWNNILSRLNGKKRLILGNHDRGKLKILSKYFKIQDLYGLKPLCIDGFKFVLSHVPLHPHCIGRWGDLNIHGHIHDNDIINTDLIEQFNHDIDIRDNRYINVCVDKTNYRPINLEEIKNKVNLI